MLLSSVNPLTTAINVVTYLAKAENVNSYCVLCKLSRFVLLQADGTKNNTICSKVSKCSLSKHPFCLFIWNVQDTISKFTMEDSTSESPSTPTNSLAKPRGALILYFFQVHAVLGNKLVKQYFGIPTFGVGPPGSTTKTPIKL